MKQNDAQMSSCLLGATNGGSVKCLFKAGFADGGCKNIDDVILSVWVCLRGSDHLAEKQVMETLCPFHFELRLQLAGAQI